MSSLFADVLHQYNSSGDNSMSATFQLDKRFSNHLSFNVGYNYSKTKDRMCMTSSISSSNFRYAVLQGPLDNRPLSTSCFDVPSKLAATVIFDAPMGFTASLTYQGSSGTPFTYINNYDANGDGWGGNDPIYVPLASDTTLKSAARRPPAEVQRLHRPAVLPQQRAGHGRRAEHLPQPVDELPQRAVSKSFPTLHGQSFEISLDIFNLPNLISSSWGVVQADDSLREPGDPERDRIRRRNARSQTRS